MRKQLSKKQRFDVFKRDLFVCQYCGRKPPAVVLEVDHVVPVAGGGSNDEHNLITSCFDCNRGKSASPLEAAPIDVEERRKLLEQRREQVVAYEALLAEQRAEEEGDIDCVIGVYESAFEGWTLLDRTRPSIRQFLKLLAFTEVYEAMEIACSRVDKDRAWRYFCGVCWRKARGESL